MVILERRLSTPLVRGASFSDRLSEASTQCVAGRNKILAARQKGDR